MGLNENPRLVQLTPPVSFYTPCEHDDIRGSGKGPVARNSLACECYVDSIQSQEKTAK